ncbi:papilin isoform 2-T3 [Spinachia spinachia]
MLLPLGILQLLLAPVLTVPAVDRWDSWGPFGECSRSCGSGVTARSRRCITLRTDGGHNCVGPDKSYRTCNIQDCPEGSKDFREEQCSQFDGTNFQGKLHKWLPYYGAENACELNCIPRGENFFYRHRSSVVDGTPCHPGRRDVCVEGVCKRLGCDYTLESPQQEDPCLQCGGNGQSCHPVRNSFSVRGLPTGYNQMFIIPVGATTISIRETAATRNYLAIKNLRGEYYLNGHWVIEFSRSTPIAGTVLYYQRGAEGDHVPETIIGRGPTTEPLVVELISQEPNQGVEYEFYLPNGRSREGYYWSFGSWSSCSKECDSGHQSRSVFCTIDNESYPDYLCASLPRPQTSRTCNPHACPHVRRMAYLYPPQLWRSSKRPRAFVFSWKTGEWNTCSVTCGGGSQVRGVQCVSRDAAGPRVVEDAVCAAYSQAPATLQTCNMQKCAEYQVTGWSACSVTCGSGEQTREVTCVGSGGGMLLEEASCGALPRPAAARPCGTPSCLGQIQPYAPDQATETDPSQANSAAALHCSQSHYGCCPDGRTSAGGPQGLGCPRGPAATPVRPHCVQTSYGCCQDGVTAAWGPAHQGCSEAAAPAPTAAPSLPTENAPGCRLTTYGCCFDRTTAAGGPNGESCPEPPTHIERSICSLPRAAGSCGAWEPRYHHDVAASQCVHFWYGGCHGNSNNFVTRAECQARCRGPGAESDAGGAASGGSTGGGSRGAGRIFTAQGGSTGGSGRQAASAADHAHRGRVLLRPRRPPPAHAAQHAGPAASLTLGEVTIDKSDPSTVEALVGQRAVLPCRVSPPPSSTVTVEWRRDGVPLSTHRHHRQPNGSLLVGPLSQMDSGWFLCVATRGRERDHRYIHLSVSGGSQQVPTLLPTDGPFPRFSIERPGPSSLEMRAGQTATLSCTVVPPSVRPSVSVQWSKDGHSLSGSRFAQHSDGALTIGPLKSADSGVYTCTASSQQQLEQRQLQLRVQADLKITTAPNNIQVPEGSTALLPCVVSGDNVNIGWSRNGIPVRPDGRNIQTSSDGSLILNDVKASDEGTYTCNAYTGIYSVSATADVRVIRAAAGDDVPADCVDQPELANCKLIVYARLCSNSYYSSFCCASCTRHAQRRRRLARQG